MTKRIRGKSACATSLALTLALSLSLASLTGARGQAPGREFAAAAAGASAEAKKNGWRAVQGDAPEWLFLARELEHIGNGAFWESAADQGPPDPASEIIRYHKELKAKGIALLLVPVPPKAALYPEKFRKDFRRADVLATGPFYEKLRAGGVNVLDLEPVFSAGIASGDKLYCEQDSHWSPLACEITADKIFESFKAEPWARTAGGGNGGDFIRDNKEILTIKGDLVEDRFKIGAETLDLVRAGKKSGGKIAAVAPSDDSPVILLGDSHTLVFSEGGEMHCTAGGLLDHLQQRFGMPLDLIASKASGGDQARGSLVRKARSTPGYLDGKKLVIWCFSAREFTLGKWREIPAG